MIYVFVISQEPNYSSISRASSSGNKRLSVTDLLGEVVPANRSSLTPDMKFLGSKWSSPADFIRRSKNFGSRSLLQNHDSTDNSVLKQNKETIAACSVKRRKVTNIEEPVTVEDSLSDQAFGSASGSQPSSDNEEMKGSTFLKQVMIKL